MTEERLQKLMAHAGLGSRRSCETLIEEGRVKVNGRIATLGDKADPDTDKIEVNGRPIKIKRQTSVYIALNKPKGVISSLDDELEQGRKTVRDLIPLPGHLYPVGRLDKQSTGLMLMTNDGDLAHKLTHPRYGHSKTYHIVIEGQINPADLEQWQSGVWLEAKKTLPVQITVLQQTKQFTQLEIVMREGRKRQIRRVAAQLGYNVRQLNRVKLGPLDLGNLKPGDWRHLSKGEVNNLQKSVQQSQSKGKKGSKGKKRPSSRPPTNTPKSSKGKK